MSWIASLVICGILAFGWLLGYGVISLILLSAACHAGIPEMFIASGIFALADAITKHTKK